MWSPRPKPKVTRRPRPIENFNHQRRKLVKRKNPLEFNPCNHFGDRYYGIRHTDITQYLEQQVPTHAFAPGNIRVEGSRARGRGKRNKQERPSTAPAAVPWFGRCSSDVSDWLRKLPPAHLGLDPENKPLPYFPTKSSIVTDNRWQTRDFPPLPNILWHYWADRPSSAPLATAPNHMQFDTLLNSIKRIQPSKEGPNWIHQKSNAQTVETPRSARSGPQTPAQTPRVALTPRQARDDQKPNSSRPGSAPGVISPPTPRPVENSKIPNSPRPHSAPEVNGPSTPRPAETDRNLNSPRHSSTPGMRSPSTPRLSKNDRIPGSPRPSCPPGMKSPSTPRPAEGDRSPNSSRLGSASGMRSPRLQTIVQWCQCGKQKAASPPSEGLSQEKLAEFVKSLPLCKACGCTIPYDSPRSPRPNSGSGQQPETPRSSDNGHRSQCSTPRGGPGTPRVPTPRVMESGLVSACTPRLRTPEVQPTGYYHKPPLRPKHRERTRPHAAPVEPFHEVIRNSRKPDQQDEPKRRSQGNEPTANELSLMKPDCHATKMVWQDHFRKENKQTSWPIQAY